MTTVLEPITAMASGDGLWRGATWVGQIDETDLGDRWLHLVDGEQFSRARLLIWAKGRPRGFVEIPVTNATVDGDDVLARVAALPPVATSAPGTALPPISVVVCTRDRPEHLQAVLGPLSRLDYPDFELIVVDNNPASGLTPPVVEAFSDMPVRLIEAPGKGLSIARNAALRSPGHDIVAFTDDDVLVDPSWLTNLAARFAEDDQVACVCGMVPSAELLTPAQSYFDRRVGWARRCDTAVYTLADPPKDDCLFPLRVAQFGTGANFAVRRDAVTALGGFDEGLGIGSPTGGGEDIDLFVRVLLAGHKLVREPSAVVWHRHRRTAEELETQIHNYGLGLGGWIAKLLTQRQTVAMVLRRVGPGLEHLRGITAVDQSDVVDTEPSLDGLDRRELAGVLRGPVALLHARAAGRNAKPLRAWKTFRALDFRRSQMWGDPGNVIIAGRLALFAAVLGVVGSLGAIRALPTAILIVVVASFMLAGPGSLLLSWYPQLPTYAVLPLIPVVGLAACVVTVTGLLMVDVYHPIGVLLGLTVATTAGGLARCVFLAQRRAVSVP